MKYLRIWVCLSLLFAPAVVSAQPASTSDSADLVRALLNRRFITGSGCKPRSAVRKWCSSAAAPVTTAPETAAAHPNQVAEAPPVHMGSGRMPEMNVPSTHIAGFSDIDFAATNKPGSHSGFNEGQFVLHMNSALSSKVSFFSELSLTARSDAGTGTPPATGFNVEV
ncbi:MAG: hypothetical protein DMG58_15030, partial [Acidobacteria bacterium]